VLSSTTRRYVVAVAINARGTAIVAFQNQQGLQAARLSNGQGLGVEPLAATSQAVRSMDVFATPSDGFQASWALANLAGGEQPSALHEVTVGRARAGTDGVFSVAPASTIPLLLTPPFEPPYDSAWEVELHSNIRGDQILTWGASGPAGRSDYVASRRVGQPFAAPQALGRPLAVSSVQSVIGPTGRFTVMWTGSHTIEATSGEVSGALSAPHQVGTHGFDDLTVLPDGTTIGVWVHPEELLLGGGSIEAATSRDGLHFTRPRVISRTTAHIKKCSGPRLLVDSKHSATAEWICQLASGSSGGTKPVVEIARYSS
jgi:hypothetical protein